MAVPETAVTLASIVRVEWPPEKHACHYGIVLAPPAGGVALMAVSTGEAPYGRTGWKDYCVSVDWAASPYRDATGGRLAHRGVSYYYPWFASRVARTYSRDGVVVDGWVEILGRFKKAKNVGKFLALIERWESDGHPLPTDLGSST